MIGIKLSKMGPLGPQGMLVPMRYLAPIGLLGPMGLNLGLMVMLDPIGQLG